MDETTSLLLVAPSKTCKLLGLRAKSSNLHYDPISTILALRRIDISWKGEIFKGAVLIESLLDIYCMKQETKWENQNE